jgi:hypothetical protein
MIFPRSSIHLLMRWCKHICVMQAVAGKSSMVAEMYGVSPKTIRDIWNRKTWAQVNLPLHAGFPSVNNRGVEHFG